MISAWWKFNYVIELNIILHIVVYTYLFLSLLTFGLFFTEITYIHIFCVW